LARLHNFYYKIIYQRQPTIQQHFGHIPGALSVFELLLVAESALTYSEILENLEKFA
jgi:hypothetical protein